MSENKGFEVGQTVELKSGGPVMTITTIVADQITCSWFVNKHKHGSGTFPAAALKPAAPEEEDGSGFAGINMS